MRRLPYGGHVQLLRLAVAMSLGGDVLWEDDFDAAIRIGVTGDDNCERGIVPIDNDEAQR